MARMISPRRAFCLTFSAAIAAMVISGCNSDSTTSSTETAGKAAGSATKSTLAGDIRIDGSSTVQPISNAIREQFVKLHPGVNITVNGNGTGNGFRSFYGKESDISDASRPIKPGEFEECKEAGVSFIELPIAYDGLTIAVHPDNDWVEQLTVDQLKTIFVGDSPAQKWSDVDDSWPEEEIKIFAPGTGSGTYDYFHEVLAKEDDRELRGDMTLNEDDNILVQGVAGNVYSIGFFGVAYYEENQDKLRAVPVVNPNDDKQYLPTPENIASNKYAPFSRPLFIYVNTDSMARAEVQTFVEYFLENAPEAATQVGYAPLPESMMEKARENMNQAVSGTHFVTEDGESRSGSLVELFESDMLTQFES